MIFDKLVRRIFQFLLILFFAVIASSSLLGFASLYSPIVEIGFTVLITALLLWLLWKKADSETDPVSMKIPAWLSVLFLGCALLILFVLIIYPILRWPTSHAGDWFPWDAGLYHFPKAVELYRSGSIWDLSISYGEYPFGYESLLSFGLSLTRNLALFGPIHALIALFFVCGFWLLARRVTHLDGGLLMLLIVMLILSDKLFQFMNLWRVFTLDIYTVGKNDLFVAASLLAALWYFFEAQKDFKQGILGFSLASSLAASIKPNTLYVLLPLWIFLLIGVGRKQLGKLLAYALLMIPGLLWLVRNLILLGSPASAEAVRLSEWSIIANLGNPYFYQNIPKNLVLIVFLIALEVIIAVLMKKKEHKWNAIIAAVLFVGFICTPVTAYFGETDTLPSINWRFGETLLVWMGILVFNDIALLIQKIKQKEQFPEFVCILLAGVVLTGSSVFLYSQRATLQAVPQNAIILHDQFWESVGMDGCWSAYDYVQKNVHDSVVWVENGLPFYLYDADFTNTVSRQGEPDYVVGFKKDWFGDGYQDYPDLIKELIQDPAYEMVYQDGEGLVLKRK